MVIGSRGMVDGIIGLRVPEVHPVPPAHHRHAMVRPAGPATQQGILGHCI